MKAFCVALCVISFTSAAVLAAEGDLYITSGNKTIFMSRVPYVTYTVLGTNVFKVNDTEVPCKNGVPARVTTEVNAELRVTTSTKTSFYRPAWKKRFAAMDGVSGDEQGHLIGSVFGGPVDKWNFVPLYNISDDFTSPYAQFNEFENWARLQVEKYNAKGPLLLLSSPPVVTFTVKLKYYRWNGCRPVSFEITGTSSGPTHWHRYAMTFDNGPYLRFG